MSQASQSNGFGRDHFNDFDMDSKEFNDEYARVAEELTARCPVAHSQLGTGYYVLSRLDDVRQAAQDWKTFSSAQGFQPNRPEGMPYMYPEESDPPYHNMWRTTLNKHFSPQAVGQYRDQVNAFVHQLVDGFVDRGECDWVQDFAIPLPGMAFFVCYMGVPVDEIGPIQEAIHRALFGPLEGRPGGWGDAMAFVNDYMLERAKEPPRGDFVDTVVAAEGVTFEGGPPPWEHKVSVVTDLLAGGIGTTTYALSGLAYHLAQHPEDRARLLKDASLRPAALEEITRYFAAVALLGRTVMADVNFAGHDFKAGDFVMLGYGLACRDVNVYDEPDRINIDRAEKVNAAFGFGPHRCIGSNLARLELSLTLDAMLDRMPEFRIRPGFAPTYQTGLTRHMNNLELVWDPTE